MKNKMIILLVLLGLLFCINLNKSISVNKNDHTKVVTINNHYSQIIGILDSPQEDIYGMDIYTTPAISFNVEPVNSINEVVTTIGMIKEVTTAVSKDIPFIDYFYTIQLLYKYELYINNLSSRNIVTKSTLKFLPKTFVSVESNKKEWKGFNIYLNQITKKLGRT